jgi:two-component system OmpR family sensor kinase
MNSSNSLPDSSDVHPNDNFQRFLQRLDHELKNPLTAIRFALANLSTMVDGDAAQSAIKSIMAQTLRISHILRDVRKLADLDHMQIERIPVNIGNLLNEAVSHAQTMPNLNSSTITLDMDDLPPNLTVNGDKYLLLLAIFNVLDNAIKFSREGGEINIQPFVESDKLVIQVIDNGCGIAQSDLELVWEELYRAPTTRHIAGSGLGLAMVKAIVERHEGEVALQSDIGKGTMVRLVLPLDS